MKGGRGGLLFEFEGERQVIENLLERQLREAHSIDLRNSNNQKTVNIFNYFRNY